MKNALNKILKSSSISLPQLSGHNVCNPSIIIKNNKIYTIYKGINYNLPETGYECKRYAGFNVPFSDTQNYYAEISIHNELKLVNVGFIEDRHIRKHPLATCGIQDIRIFNFKDKLWGIGNGICYENPSKDEQTYQKRNTLYLFSIKNNLLSPICTFQTNNKHEKNWMPWVNHKKLLFVYAHNPLTVIEFIGPKYKVIKQVSRNDLDGFFGGTQIIPLNSNVNLGLIHQKHFDINLENKKTLQYSHRAVIYSNDLDVLDYSEEFTFSNNKIEFCSGIAIDQNNIYLSYGVWDSKAIISKFNLLDFLKFCGLKRWLK